MQDSDFTTFFTHLNLRNAEYIHKVILSLTSALCDISKGARVPEVCHSATFMKSGASTTRKKDGLCCQKINTKDNNYRDRSLKIQKKKDKTV